MLENFKDGKILSLEINKIRKLMNRMWSTQSCRQSPCHTHRNLKILHCPFLSCNSTILQASTVDYHIFFIRSTQHQLMHAYNYIHTLPLTGTCQHDQLHKHHQYQYQCTMLCTCHLAITTCTSLIDITTIIISCKMDTSTYIALHVH